MPATSTYRRRKAAGRCARCGERCVDAHVCCGPCRAAQRGYMLEHATTGLAPHIAGPALACCDRWWPIDALPFRCGRCHGVRLA